MNTQYGFRVLGGPSETRRLVNWQKAFSAYCTGEAAAGEAYLSAWTYGPELLGHMAANGGVAGYCGPCFAEWIPVDIDGTGADPVAEALDRTRRLLAWLHSQGADPDKLSCWFSGGKGFHILLPVLGLADAKPGSTFNKAVRAFVTRIGAASGAGPDTTIYDAVRIFRAPNTRHPKTGLYKVSLRADEILGGITPDKVRQIAAEPCPGDTPEPEVWCDWTIGGLGSIWGEALQESTAPSATRKTVDRETLNRDTLDFIRNGAVHGERERRCFMAAANLAELGASERLARALLLEPAIDSGLSPNEAQRAITGGVKRGRECRV